MRLPLVFVRLPWELALVDEALLVLLGGVALNLLEGLVEALDGARCPVGLVLYEV